MFKLFNTFQKPNKKRFFCFLSNSKLFYDYFFKVKTYYRLISQRTPIHRPTRCHTAPFPPVIEAKNGDGVHGVQLARFLGGHDKHDRLCFVRLLRAWLRQSSRLYFGCGVVRCLDRVEWYGIAVTLRRADPMRLRCTKHERQKRKDDDDGYNCGFHG